MPTVSEGFNFGITDVRNALSKARLLEALFLADTPEDARRSAAFQDFSADAESIRMDLGPTVPLRWARWRNGSAYYMAIEGIENISQGRDTWTGYSGGVVPFTQATEGKNRTFNEWAQTIFENMGGPFNPYPSEFHVFGHSAGGYVGALLATKLQNYYRSAVVTSTTFGTPKVGTREVFSPTVAHQAWWNRDDPVIGIPPRPDPPAAWMVALIPQQLYLIQFFEYHGNATRIDQDGSLHAQAGPENPASPDWVEAAAWLINLAQNVSTPHGIQEYVTRLTRAQPAAAIPTPVDPTPVRLPPSEEITRSEARQILTRAQQTSFMTNRAPSTSTPTLPEAQIFRVRRSGRSYSVVFGNTIICLAPHKKRAHGLARAGNDFLRRLQLQGRVDPEAIARQFVDYVEAASGVDNGFFPVMQVVPPIS